MLLVCYASSISYVNQALVVVRTLLISYILCTCCGLGSHEHALTPLLLLSHVHANQVFENIKFLHYAHTRGCAVIDHQKGGD